MPKLLFVFAFFFLSSATRAEPVRVANYTCAYKFMNIDFSQVKIGLLDSGAIEDFVTVTAHGKSHRESSTPEALKAGEEIHLWISKESEQNSLELIIYKERKSAGKSVMINPHIPMGKEMWGECLLEQEKPKAI